MKESELENIKVRVESMRFKYYSTGTVGLSFLSVSLSLSVSVPSAWGVLVHS